jgi:hypothetical protein
MKTAPAGWDKYPAITKGEYAYRRIGSSSTEVVDRGKLWGQEVAMIRV